MGRQENLREFAPDGEIDICGTAPVIAASAMDAWETTTQ